MSPFQQLVLEGNLRAERREVAKMSVPREIIQNLTSPPLAIPIFLGPWAMVACRDPQDNLPASLVPPQPVD